MSARDNGFPQLGAVVTRTKQVSGPFAQLRQHPTPHRSNWDDGLECSLKLVGKPVTYGCSGRFLSVRVIFF